MRALWFLLVVVSLLGPEPARAEPEVLERLESRDWPGAESAARELLTAAGDDSTAWAMAWTRLILARERGGVWWTPEVQEGSERALARMARVTGATSLETGLGRLVLGNGKREQSVDREPLGGVMDVVALDRRGAVRAQVRSQRSGERGVATTVLTDHLVFVGERHGGMGRRVCPDEAQRFTQVTLGDGALHLDELVAIPAVLTDEELRLDVEVQLATT